MIIPAIDEANLHEIEKKLKIIDGKYEYVQIDICDGTMTTNKTITDLSKIGSLAGKTKIEVHLMTQKPLLYLDKKIKGISSICTQIEAENYVDRFVYDAKNLGYNCGLSLEIDTPLEKVDKYIPRIDFVQLMGIAHIGPQGSPFDIRVIDRIKNLRSKYPKIVIQVDGGITEQNKNTVLQSGADDVVMGSALFGNLPMQQEDTKVTSIFTHKKINKIAFLGGAGWKETELAYTDAYEVAKVLAENGYEIVNGGGPGVMEASTKGGHAGGSKVLAVTYHPSKKKKNFEGVYEGNEFDEEVITLDYFDRTKVMLQNTDMHIVFNGSTGTISEFGMTWASSRIHGGDSKPIILYGKFWNEILDVIQKTMKLRPGERDLLKICTTPQEVLEYVQRFDSFGNGFIQ